MLAGIKNLMRPSFVEENQTNEQNEEATKPIMEIKKQTTNAQAQPFEQLSNVNVNYGMLNSEIFTNDSENVKVAEPRDFEDAEVIAEAIYAGKTVVMFLDTLDNALQQRIIDYIGGYCKAFNIQPEQMRSGWVIDPKHKRTQTYR